MLILVLVMISLMVFIVTGFLAYQTSIQQMRQSLAEIAFSRAQLINTVLDFDSEQYTNFPSEGLDATLYQLDKAHRKAPGFGESGEFVLARREIGYIEFLVEQRFQTGNSPAPIKWESELAEPMRRALSGKNGSIIGLDYRGVKVLAAYATVPNHNLGVVMKIDIWELQAPYREKGIVLTAIIICLVAAGALAFITISRPVIKALVKSESRLKKGQEIANMGNWEWHTSSDVMHWSDHLFVIFGQNPNTFTPRYDHFIANIHSDDREHVENAIAHLIANHKEKCAINHRIVLPDGTIKYVREMAEVFSDATSPTAVVVGTVVDITEYSTIQQSLTLYERTYQSIDDSVLIFDLDGKVIDCNKAYEETTGFKREEVLGTQAKLERYGLLERGAVIDKVRQNGEWRGELWDVRKNGEHFPIHASFSTIFDAQKHATHTVMAFHDISDEYKHKHELEKLAFFDQLTGLPNRTKLSQIIQGRINTLVEGYANFAVCLLDVDEFKTLNTSLGYDMGDELLKQIADRLSCAQNERDDLGRIGGDEFLLVINATEPEQSLELAIANIFNELRYPFTIGTSELTVGVSAGIACYPKDGDNANTLIANAELALDDYRAKERRGYQFFTKSMKADAKQRRDLEVSLQEGIKRKEFEMHYQPKIAIADNRVMGAESLVRWNRPDGKFVSPIDFITLAENTGLMVELGQQIISSSLGMCRQVNRTYNNSLQIAVNISPRQFIQKDLVEVFDRNLTLLGISPELLEIEITESAAMIGIDHMVERLKSLKDLGCSIAIDDFGTGYSSLSYLKRFPIDTLKIDRAFVSGITNQQGDAEMVKAIMSMAKSLKLQTVAEGVETLEQFTFLKELGCDIAQGYLFSKPLPSDEFIDYVNYYQTLADGAKLKSG